MKLFSLMGAGFAKTKPQRAEPIDEPECLTRINDERKSALARLGDAVSHHRTVVSRATQSHALVKVKT